ncbi:MAG: glycosyltransferase family 61 protein [Burkholderiaceae bacterium]
MGELYAAVPALGTAWVHTLAQQCAQAGLPFPGGEQLLNKLGKPEAPVGARGRLAQAIHHEWVKGQEDVAPWQLRALVEAIEGWWQSLPEGMDPLAAGLAPAWARAQGALERIEPLAQAVKRWAPKLADPEHETLALALLRQMRRLKGAASIEPSLALVDALGGRWTPDAAWTVDLTGTLAMVARTAESLAPMQRVAVWVERLVDGLAERARESDAEAWRAPLAAAAVRCASLPAMQRLAEAMLQQTEPDAGSGHTLATLIEALANLAPLEQVRPLVDKAAKAWPRQPAIQVEHARLARAGGASAQQLAGALRSLDASHPATPVAWQLLAEYAFHDGELDLARECYERLQQLDAIDEQAELRLAHLTLQQSPAAGAGAAAAPVLAEAGLPELGADQLGPLADTLSALAAVLAVAPRHDSDVNAAVLSSRGARALIDFEQRLPALHELSLAEGIAAAGHLWSLANSGALDLAHWDGVFPFTVGPAFGTLDGLRCQAQCFSLLHHLVALCRHLLRRERPLRGAPGDASVEMLLEAARHQIDARLALKSPRDALADLAEWQQALGPLGSGALLALREKALLAAGEVDTLRAELAALPGSQVGTPRGPEPLAMREWDDWLAAEGVQAHPLLKDGPCVGKFEVVDIHGRVRVETHEAVPTVLSLARFSDLRVRNVHLLIGPKAGILRPHPWHLQMGEFPYPHPNVLARGTAGAVLRGAGLWKRVDDPLVVLANMDAPFHRNYYHWMVLTLARVQALMTRGILKTRKLLLPRELTGWMLGSLHDIGLDESRVRWYTAEDDLRLTDALVASPVEFASPTMVAGLRRGLFQAAGLDPKGDTQSAGLDPKADLRGDRLIYLARRGETRRPMVEAEQLINIAEELGFEIVAAETLSLLDQVRLFASARGIAGPPGAAFTNLMWAPPGTRVLTIFKQDINGPTFFDLSFLRRQRHRWLQARSVAGFESVSIVTSPFSVDLGLARRELEWVREAGKTRV